MAKLTETRMHTYHQLQARLGLSLRIARAKEYDRARAEIARRLNTHVTRAIASNASLFSIRCDQMAPYVQKHGKHSVTAWIRENLPPYYAARSTSMLHGGKVNGWRITRIG